MPLRQPLLFKPLASRLATIACGSLFVLSGCSKAPQPATSAPNRQADAAPVLQSEVLTVQPNRWPVTVRTQGSLFADEVAVVGTKVAGRVAEVHVDLGDVIRGGLPLVTLDRREFELQVSQAQAQLQQARSAVGLGPNDPLEQLAPENSPPVREAKAVWDEARTKSERWQQLRRQNALSETEALQAQAAEQVAAAQYSSALNAVNEKIALIGVRAVELSLAQQRLQDVIVRAPFDGVVQNRHVAPGSYVQIGESIATVVRTNPVHFRGMMPERHARKLRLGQEVRLQIEGLDDPRVVRVTRVSPTLDPLSRSLLFEAEVANEDGALQTGLFAEAVVILDDTAKAIVVPDSAVTEFAGVEKVWKVVDGIAQEQVVVTGERRGGHLQILSGLEANDVVLWKAAEGRVAKVEAIPKPFSLEPNVALMDAEAAEGNDDSDASEDLEIGGP
jgi:membrane fusion protein, multidrug efflux system